MRRIPAAANLIHASPVFEIQGEYIISTYPGEDRRQAIMRTRRNMRAEIARLTACLDDADDLEARGIRADGLRRGPNAWDKAREKWRAQCLGKTISQKYPNAEFIFDPEFIEIEQDIVFLTRPTARKHYKTMAMPLETFTQSLAICGQAVADYRRAAAEKVVRFPTN